MMVSEEAVKKAKVKKAEDTIRRLSGKAYLYVQESFDLQCADTTVTQYNIEQLHERVLQLEKVRKEKPGVEGMRIEAEKRIGDPTRDKWLAFLGKAFELGYITLDEYQRRAETVLHALTMSQVRETHADLPTQDWDNAWDEKRKEKIYLSDRILPDVPQPVTVPDVQGVPASTWVDNLFGAGVLLIIAGGWIMFILAVLGVL
jgi:Domain of unknown function (DUF1707)